MHMHEYVCKDLAYCHHSSTNTKFNITRNVSFHYSMFKIFQLQLFIRYLVHTFSYY